MAGSVLLIVVEGPVHRSLFNRYLGNTAHHLVFATNGEEAFDRYGEVKPDLVIAHLHAAGLDGTILCQLLRKEPRGEHVPYVLLGEELTDPVLGRERAAAVGADGFLPFPFDRQKLIEQITPLLTFGRMEPSGRRAEPLPADARRTLAEPALEKLRSVQVSPELAQESRTEAAPPRGASFSQRPPSNIEEVPAKALSVRGKSAVEEPHAKPSETLDETDGAVPIVDAVEAPSSAAEASDEVDWAGTSDGLIAEPEAPVVGRALAESADTVVSFVNPFVQSPELRFPTGDVPTGAAQLPKLPPFESPGSSAERTDGAVLAFFSDAQVQVPLDATQPADLRALEPRSPEVSVDDESTHDEGALQKPLPRASSSRTDGRLEPRLDLRPEVIVPRAEAKLEPPRVERPEAARPERGVPERAAPERVAPERVVPERVLPERVVPERLELRPDRREELLLEEPPIIDRPARDPLEELPISGLAPVPNHSDASQAARMIQEPMRELTPSASDRARRDSMSGGRRGLDESQLGKRLAKRVRTMFRLLEEVDYYQILGVDRDAPAEVLKRAYFDLSLEFHPDRFFLLRSGDLKEKIYAIYRRVTEAYSVLSDERRRRAYDEARFGRPSDKRAAPELRDEEPRTPAAEPKGGLLDVPTANPKAKRLLELARLAMDEGDVNGARLHLHLALAYEDHPTLKTAIDRVAQLARPASRL